jgi:hypothetical protein
MRWGFRGAAQQLINIGHADKYLHVGASAFTPSECEQVKQWVREVGSLLLISDHAPAGEAAVLTSQVARIPGRDFILAWIGRQR